jgi:hypothetical protein
MTSRMYMAPHVSFCRVINHLWVNKVPYQESGASPVRANMLSRKHYGWKPDHDEALSIRAASKGYRPGQRSG